MGLCCYQRSLSSFTRYSHKLKYAAFTELLLPVLHSPQLV